jgi:hypothetical protein
MPKRTQRVAVTEEEHAILEQMAKGWKPYPFQLSGAEDALLRKRLVKATSDAANRAVLEITETGRAAAQTEAYDG